MNNGEMMRWGAVIGIAVALASKMWLGASDLAAMCIAGIIIGIGILADFIIAIHKDRKRGGRR